MRIANLSTKSGSLSSSDKFVTDNGTAVTKIDYNALAKAIIEQYTGSTLAGSAQSVKAALDALNSKNTMKSLAAGNSMNISSANARYILILIGGTTGMRGAYIVAGYSSSAEIKAISEATSGAVSTSGANVTINNTSQYAMNVCAIIFAGSITMS